MSVRIRKLILIKKQQFHFYHYGDKNSLFAVDLCDLFGAERDRIAELNSGYKYFFMYINALTKHLLVYPIKSRKGSEILKAFKKSILKSGLNCERKAPSTSIHCDQEFLTNKIKKLCKDNCINIYYSQSDHKSALIERAIRSFKAMMVRRMEAKRSEKWVPWLDSLVNQYNSQMIHSSIRMTPNEAELHPSLAWIRLLEKYSRNSRFLPFKFRMGDWVRLRASKENIFRKGYLRKFTAEIYKIIFRRHVNNANVYYLESAKGKRLPGGFNEQLLVLGEKDATYALHVLKTDKDLAYVHYDGFGSSDDEWVDKSRIIN